MNELIAQARRMALSLSKGLSKGQAFVYLLRLESGAIYVGCTLDVESRLDAYASGTACRTTHRDGSIALLLLESQPDFTTARRREAQIKRWSHAKKEALIAGDAEALRRLSKSRESSPE